MKIKSVFELPEFDTGQYESCRFVMERGDAELTINVVGVPNIRISFRMARYHEFTALYNCTAEQIEGAYFRLAEIVGSEKLRSYIANDTAGARAYKELHHYRIFLDETGCHEIFAETATYA